MANKAIKLVAKTSLAGRFKMPYDKGHVFSVKDEKQATEMVESGFADYAPKETKKTAPSDIPVNDPETVNNGTAGDAPAK